VGRPLGIQQADGPIVYRARQEIEERLFDLAVVQRYDDPDCAGGREITQLNLKPAVGFKLPFLQG